MSAGLGRRAALVLTVPVVLIAVGLEYGATALVDLVVVLLFWGVDTGGHGKDIKA